MAEDVTKQYEKSVEDSQNEGQFGEPIDISNPENLENLYNETSSNYFTPEEDKKYKINLVDTNFYPVKRIKIDKDKEGNETQKVIQNYVIHVNIKEKGKNEYQKYWELTKTRANEVLKCIQNLNNEKDSFYLERTGQGLQTRYKIYTLEDF